MNVVGPFTHRIERAVDKWKMSKEEQIVEFTL